MRLLWVDVTNTLLLVYMFLLPEVWALGSYKYCCQIAKCNKIVDGCRISDVHLNGTTCTESCLTDFECVPHDTLAERNYSCFQPYLNDTNSPLNLRCGQSFTDGLQAAPRVLISYDFCASECSGWRLSEFGEPVEWAAPILQYILPAVIFSMTIPRRHKLEVPDKLFDYKFDKWTNLAYLILSILLAGIIVAVDTVVWVFVIFAGAGPMLVGGLHEAVLDRRIVIQLEKRNPERKSNRTYLSEADKAELLLAVVSGNLDRIIGDPETRLRAVVGLRPVGTADRTPSQISRSSTSLLSMMASQQSFGTIVGAPVLFYLGAFIYNVTGLKTNKGDNDTSRKTSPRFS